MNCANCSKNLTPGDNQPSHRYRLHFEPYGITSRVKDKFFCCVPCIRDWAARVAEEAR
jgi:hypothetical protein